MAEKNIQQMQIEAIAKQLSSPRINDADKAVIRNTFFNRQDLIIAVRNLFFGQATMHEMEEVKAAFESPETRRVLRKVILPTMQPDDPLKQSIDLWQTVKIDDVEDNRVYQLVEARAALIEMLEQSLQLLDNGGVGEPVDLSVDPKTADFVRLMARNSFISHVETQLVMIVTMAMTTPETPEEAMLRMKKDSNQ